MGITQKINQSYSRNDFMDAVAQARMHELNGELEGFETEIKKITHMIEEVLFPPSYYRQLVNNLASDMLTRQAPYQTVLVQEFIKAKKSLDSRKDKENNRQVMNDIMLNTFYNACSCSRSAVQMMLVNKGVRNLIVEESIKYEEEENIILRGGLWGGISYAIIADEWQTVQLLIEDFPDYKADIQQKGYRLLDTAHNCGSKDTLDFLINRRDFFTEELLISMALKDTARGFNPQPFIQMLRDKKERENLMATVEKSENPPQAHTPRKTI